jgi:alpha-tubulin suppressor-like RCC1 family protein
MCLAAHRFRIVLAVYLAATIFGCSRSRRESGPAADGSGSVTVKDTPPATTGFVQVAAGSDVTCGRTEKGEVFCWGDNAFTSSTMSAGSIPPPLRTSPSPVRDLSDVVDMDVASSHGCAVRKSGEVLCWRDRTVDVLSNPHGVALQALPVGINDAAFVRASLAAMPKVCVTHRNGSATCLSADRNASTPTDPKKVEGLGDIASVEPGDMHSCALTKAGRVFCWGSNLIGGLGQPGVSSRPSAQGAPPILEGVTMLASGSALSCAVKEAKAFCWGSNGAGQAGGHGESLEKPTEVSGVSGVRRVQPGVYHTCAVDEAGHVRCWGDNRFGQLGQRGANVSGLENAIDVAVGQWHSCALLKTGQIYCWGRNQRGQLGDGSSTDSPTPRPVILKDH